MKNMLQFIVIDEHHCISDFSFSFRKEFNQMQVNVLELFLATTHKRLMTLMSASNTNESIADATKILNLQMRL